MLTRIQQIFQQHDANRTNTLDLERVYAGLVSQHSGRMLQVPTRAGLPADVAPTPPLARQTQLGHTLDKQPGGAFYTLCQSFDFDLRGLISLDSLVAMAVTLDNARKVFDRFGTDPVRAIPPARGSF